ncbi:inverse autotransporter beta domain-containing protein [Enterobacter sp. 22452]|uniref:inverse autotransporter beta domain-containing protein n=1 Tax=Enterobacter sp. 22452 TaxID=3453920 RepID=UPI003F873C37
MPSYPQLGTRVMYEKYHGDKVALFDKDNLQSNPSAVTVGLNNTPVTLITDAVDYKRGQDSMDDTRFSLNFYYTQGQPWRSQISADDVSRRRSLVGSRYDLVDRNDKIVLQYKDKCDVLTDMTFNNVKDNSPADSFTGNVTARFIAVKAATIIPLSLVGKGNGGG